MEEKHAAVVQRLKEENKAALQEKQRELDLERDRVREKAIGAANSDNTANGDIFHNIATAAPSMETDTGAGSVVVYSLDGPGSIGNKGNKATGGVSGVLGGTTGEAAPTLPARLPRANQGAPVPTKTVNPYDPKPGTAAGESEVKFKFWVGGYTSILSVAHIMCSGASDSSVAH